MKSAISLIFFLILTHVSFAKRPIGPSYTVISSKPDSTLKIGQSVFDFIIYAEDSYCTRKILYSDNGVETTGKMSNGKRLIHESIPGKHAFLFYLTDEFYEIEIDNLSIESGYRTVVELNFRSSTQPMTVKKPVIYLYPETETQIQVDIAPKGELFFTYPTYDNGWNVTAKPNGDLLIDGKEYSYLFWESEQNMDNSLVDFNQGSVVKSSDLLSFFEHTLSAYGLNSKEQADFITYWVPNMLKSKNVYIYFVFDEDCEAFATLDISPKPDKIGRLYMLWSPIDETVTDSFTEQEIPALDRKGFTVIEWGGAEINYKERPETRL